MVQPFSLYENKLREAAEFLSVGQKKNACLLIREVLAADENNLAAWELLFRASYNADEQIVCLERLLKLQPDHPWARQQLAFVKATANSRDGMVTYRFESYPRKTLVSTQARKKRREPLLVWAGIIFGCLGLLCLGTWALAVYRLGVLPIYARNGTATAFTANQISCQALIDQAMETSGQYCSQIGPNRVCYGNNTVKADLVPNASQRFSKRGDIVNITQLERLSASPLNTNSNEWGIAIFQVQANLPRSLPGEMIKMVVFGNTSLKKTSENLQSFYFSSELGQLVCEKLPFDGLMVTMPNGTGIKFTVNGAEMTLMGNASFNANKGDKMQVSLFSGSARIVARGLARYFGAGQKVDVRLGGVGGTEAIGPPSAPQPLSPAEFSVACTLTGRYCSQSEIKPISLEQIQTQILSALGIVPTPTKTPTSTITPTETTTAIPSLTSIPTLTPVPTFTITPTGTRILLLSPTRTLTPKPRTPTNTSIPPIVSTSTTGPSQTPTLTPTTTNSPTITLTPSETSTPTETDTPLPTSTPPTAAVCSDVITAGLINTGSELDMEISNKHGGPVSMMSLHIVWVKKIASQKLTRVLLNGDTSWNTSDPIPPSDIPSESDWQSGAILSIPDAIPSTFVAQFQDPLEAGDYSIAVVLDIGCQVQASISVP